MIPTYCNPNDAFTSHLGPNSKGELFDGHFEPCISFPTAAELIGWFESMEHQAVAGAFGAEDLTWDTHNGSCYSGADAVGRIQQEIARIKA